MLIATYEYEDEYGYEHRKVIGVFSSEEKMNETFEVDDRFSLEFSPAIVMNGTVYQDSYEFWSFNGHFVSTHKVSELDTLCV